MKSGCVSRTSHEARTDWPVTVDGRNDVMTGTTLEIHHVDVGQGESTIIVVKEGSKDVVVVIDGGRTTRGGKLVAEYLTKLGVKNIDVLVTSH